MDSRDSRVAHSPEASTDERASLPTDPPPETAGSAFPFPAVRFATRAEEEAYWLGVRAGAEAAEARGAAPIRHVPPGLDVALTRGPGEPALVSGKLSDAGADGADRKLRHDGWTAGKERIFLTTLAATGVVADACRVCGMSRDAAYNRRNSAAGRAFALAWQAALVLAHPAMVDEVMSRARHGVIERVYRGGELVAERHRHDNRLAMAVVTRLDRQLERLAEREPAVGAVAEEFEQFLDLLPGGNEAVGAFLAARLGHDPLAPGRCGPGGGRFAPVPADPRRAPAPRGDIFIDDLDPDEMEEWTQDQLERAVAAGLLADLDPLFWPPAALDGEADGTEGMCKLRKLYLQVKGPRAGDWAYG